MSSAASSMRSTPYFTASAISQLFIHNYTDPYTNTPACYFTVSCGNRLSSTLWPTASDRLQLTFAHTLCVRALYTRSDLSMLLRKTILEQPIPSHHLRLHCRRSSAVVYVQKPPMFLLRPIVGLACDLRIASVVHLSNLFILHLFWYRQLGSRGNKCKHVAVCCVYSRQNSGIVPWRSYLSSACRGDEFGLSNVFR